ncbi:MAG: LLM class flavin-dependent oxidoreductase [Dehalococcoidia bacterium]|nr:LLM class flavin-dependent oxidoreductase [Dehalococcoidia bacterium]
MKKDNVQFGIAIPQTFPSGKTDLSLLSGFISKAESLGYHSAWVQERAIGGGISNLDPIPLLSYVAALSSRLKLGTSVMLSDLRNPINFAKSLATLDQLSGGRLIVGLGIGGSTDVYAPFGISPRGRARRFEEGILLMKKLWSEENVTFHGRFWQTDGASISPRPLQTPHLPLWFGAHSPAALRRAVRLGDGWMGAGSATTRAFKEEIKLVRLFLVEEGRDPTTFALAKRVYVAVVSDKKAASERLQEWFGERYGRSGMALDVSVFGSEEECVEGLGEVVSEGVDLLMLNPVYDELEQAERLTRDIIPKL